MDSHRNVADISRSSASSWLSKRLSYALQPTSRRSTILSHQIDAHGQPIQTVDSQRRKSVDELDPHFKLYVTMGSGSSM